MLTRCPSCQASVLEDDAEVCPFCGSPMDPAKAKGFKPANKPTAAPAAPKPAKTPTGKPESSEPKRKPAPASGVRDNAPTRPTAPTNKDPFAVDPSSIKGVTPLSRKRTPQNPEKIVCPMCDTTGYAPVSASGKDVRCANPKCMVPVFAAPNFAAPQREKIVEPSSTKSTVLILLGVALVVFGGGFAYWWMNFRAPQQPPVVAGPGGGPGPAVTPSDTPQAEDPEPETPATTANQGPTGNELREQAFARWSQSLNTVADLPRRLFRYRLAAESYAMAGNLDQAREHLRAIEEAGESNRFYQIAPLTQILWAELKQGDTTAATRTFERIAPLRETIPNTGFDPARNVIFWSAAAAQAGQTDAAAQLAMAPRTDIASERLLANLESAAAFTKFNLDADHPWRPVLSWQHPKLAGTAFHLVRHQQLDAARNLAAAVSDSTARAEAASIWAEGMTEAGATAHDAIQQAAPADNPAIALFINARAGLRASARGNKDLALQLLAKADSLVQQIPAASPVDASTAGKLHQIDLQGLSTEKLHAAAFAEAAHLAAALEKPENAHLYLWRGVDHLRAAAPPAAQVTARQREFEATGLSGIQQTLASELGLSGAPAEDAATEYRRRLPQFRTVANEARDQQGRLLAAGISWGLGDAILAEAQNRDSASADEKLLSGSLGGRILAAFMPGQKGQNSEAAETVQSAGVSPRDIPRDAGLELAVWPLVEAGKTSEAASQLMSSNWQSVPASQRLGLAMRVVTRLASQQKPGEVIAFVRPITIESDRQELYQVWGAYAAASDHGARFLDAIGRSRLPITLLAGAIYGVAQGLNAPSLPDTESSSPESVP